MIYPRVSIIILNWNGWRDTIECLESVYQIEYLDFNVIIVDNGSKDESIKKMKEYADGKIEIESAFFSYVPSNKPIKFIEYTKEETEINNSKSDVKLIIIKNKKNDGFAEGNNLGMRYALNAFNPEYILLLNNDTVVDKAFLGELLKAADIEEKIGIVGPKIYYYADPGTIQTMGVNINFWTGGTIPIGHKKTDEEIVHDSRVFCVDYVYGACLLIKSRVIKDIGMLDPIFFLYNEEIDWCLRSKKRGYKSICCLSSKIWHKSQASSSKEIKFSVYYPIRNRIILLRRYSPRFLLIISLVYFILFNFLVIIHNIGVKQNYIIWFVRGVKDGLFDQC